MLELITWIQEHYLIDAKEAAIQHKVSGTIFAAREHLDTVKGKVPKSSKKAKRQYVRKEKCEKCVVEKRVFMFVLSNHNLFFYFFL